MAFGRVPYGTDRNSVVENSARPITRTTKITPTAGPERVSERDGVAGVRPRRGRSDVRLVSSRFRSGTHEGGLTLGNEALHARARRTSPGFVQARRQPIEQNRFVTRSSVAAWVVNVNATFVVDPQLSQAIPAPSQSRHREYEPVTLGEWR